MSHGFEKVRGLIKRELALALDEAKDPRLSFVTLMDVKLSPDLRHATAYISAFNEEQEAEVLQVLQAHRGHFRSELAKRLRLKHTPELLFRIDEVEKKAQRLEQLFRQLNSERPH